LVRFDSFFSGLSDLIGRHWPPVPPDWDAVAPPELYKSTAPPPSFRLFSLFGQRLSSVFFRPTFSGFYLIKSLAFFTVASEVASDAFLVQLCLK